MDEEDRCDDMKATAAMFWRLVLGWLLATVCVEAVAQLRSNIEKHGNVSILEVSSAELTDLLTMVGKRTGIIADKWEMPTEVLTQDVIVAKEIVFARGSRLILSPRNLGDDNVIMFIGQTITVQDPLTMVWDRNIGGQAPEPIRAGKAGPGAAGEREGAPGRPGASGIVGNRGARGRDAPGVVFVALKLNLSASIQFELMGQDAGNGGAGQDGGDGGAGRQGRPGQLEISNVGQLNVKREAECSKPINGGDGGDGGNGGPGGEGGRGGSAGGIGVIALDISRREVRQLVSPKSILAPGKNGIRGPRGLGGRGGPGAPELLAAAPCEPSKRGRDGKPGEGRDSLAAEPSQPVDQPAASQSFVVFSKMNESQARSIGLMAPAK